MLIKVEKRTMDKGVVFFYLLFTFTGVIYFDIFHPVTLIGLALFLFYAIISIKNRTVKLSGFFLLFLLVHLISAVLYKAFYDFAIVCFYLINVFIVYILANEWSMDIWEDFTSAVVVMNVFNAIYLLFTTPKHITYKIVGSFMIFIRYYEGISFAYTSVLAGAGVIFLLFSKMPSWIEKRRLVKATLLIICIMTIYLLGKLSVLLGILVSVAVGMLIKYVRIKRTIVKITFKAITIFLSLSWLLLVQTSDFFKEMGINVARLGTGRDTIWADYVEYFYGKSLLGKFFGGDFVRVANDYISPGYIHPHNQWISLLISVGVIGMLLYLKLILDALDYGIWDNRISLLIYLLFLQIYITADDFFFINPALTCSLPIFYYAFKKELMESTLKIKGFERSIDRIEIR